MKGQGSSGLWLLAIGLIALFMVATMIAPALIHTNTGGTGTNGGNGSQALSFKTPTVVLGSSTVEQGGTTDLSVRATPDSATTGDGGSFAWVLRIDGANGQGNSFQVRYGDQIVQWFAGDNGALVGIGPRFTQGPGAASVEVQASFSVAPAQAGSFVIKAWIAVAKDLVTLDPTNLQACSPVQSQTLQVSEKIVASASVLQSLSGPASAREVIWSRYTLSSQGHATGKWKGSVTDYIAISKGGIKASDILARVITDRTTRYITWTDTGDRLVGTLQTSTPFQGTANSESADWATSFEIQFRNPGSYKIECWSVETSTGKALSSTIGQTVDVGKTVSLPVLTPTSPTVPTTPSNETSANSTAAGNTTYNRS